MRNVDIYGLMIITIFLGGFCTFLGAVIKTQNAADMLNNFNEKKYDKDKASKIMGKTFLIIGTSIFVVGVLGFFIGEKYYTCVSSVQSLILIFGIFVGYYRMSKYAKIK